MSQSTSRHWTLSVGGLFALAALLAACSAKTPAQQVANRGAPPVAGTGMEAGPVMFEAPECPPGNPFCTKMEPPMVLDPAMTLPPPDTSMRADCGELPTDITPAGVNIMVAIDGSASMGTHWANIQQAVMDLRLRNPDANFGLQIFWADLVDNFDDFADQANFCGETQNRVLDVGPHAAADLVTFLGDGPPGPSAWMGLYEISPVIDPLNYFLTTDTALADPTRTNYLVFISDGNDNCFGSIYASKADKLLAYQKLAVEIGKRNINILPIGFDAASMPDSSGMWGMVPPNTNLEVLQTLLDYGGSGFKEVPKVDDPTKLAEVIKQVGQSILSCRFNIPATVDPNSGVNPFQLAFELNDVEVPRDRTGTNGWNFVNGNTGQVDLFGQACEAARSGIKLEARKTCNTDVCGTSVVKVETKPRAVLLLLDESASRLECLDGTDTCFGPPNSPDRTRNYAEEVLHAIGISLTAPINDDVEFGLQFFPGKQAEVFACDVTGTPEVPPAQGTEITIMKQMLQKLPFGLSPVVGVLESVAATPGRLAEPGVLGAVVMLSDGGDNCALPEMFDPADQAMVEMAQAQMVTRLGAASKSLLDMGVRTFAVRYGSEEGRTAAGEEQLRAIVENGGTAAVDPNDPMMLPYVDAENEQELADALSAISDRLATCSFGISGVPATANKDNTNLYLNGDAVPFDKDLTKADGWGWVDPERTMIELFGPACVGFKTNRRTSIVVEFGCPPEVVPSPD
jgi:hypothetical protein